MKRINLPFFLPKTKKGIFWYLIFILIFVFYHDFWAWGKFEPLLWGWLPAWFFYLMILIVVYSIIAFFFTRKYWPSSSFDRPKSNTTQKPRKER